MSDISFVYTSDTELFRDTKDANIVFGSIPWNLSFSKTVFSYEKIKFNVVYYFQI